MPKLQVDRRKLIVGGSAALMSATWPAAASAQRKAGPGGFSAERLAALPGLLQSYVADGSVAGFVTLLFRKGEIAQVNAVGLQDREAGIPMQRGTIFRLASMTKPVTCVAALTLVDQGKIALGDRIDKWIPELADRRVLDDPRGPLDRTHAASRPITLADLLTHRAGLAGQFDSGPIAASFGKLREGDPSFDTWFQRLGALPLAYDPGSTFNYGTSHDVLGGLIQRVSGMPFADYLQQTIFGPLGMKDTGFWLPEAKRGRLATLYGRDPQSGRLTIAARPVPAAPPRFASGAGALVSTADDYLQFARMLLGKGRNGSVRILSQPLVAMMTTNWLTPEQRLLSFAGVPNFWASQGFGLGVSVTDDVARLGPIAYTSKGTFGWPGATGVWWCADPAQDMVAIYLVQDAMPGVPAPGAPSRPLPVIAFTNAVYAAIDS